MRSAIELSWVGCRAYVCLGTEVEIVVLSLVLSCLVASPTLTYVRYRGPSEVEPLAGRGPLTLYEVTRYDAGSVAWTARPGVNIWDRPGGEIVASLTFGERVTVSDNATGLVRVGDRVDRWYRVGWTKDGATLNGVAFGGDLTPIGFETNLDSDDSPEVVTIGFEGDHAIVVRAAEVGSAEVAEVELRATGEAELGRLGGNVEARLIPARASANTLIEVASRPGACAQHATWYLAYQAKPEAARGRGELTVALALTGLIDPPYVARYSVELSKDNERAVVTFESRETEDEPLTKRTTIYERRAGSFVEVRR